MFICSRVMLCMAYPHLTTKIIFFKPIKAEYLTKHFKQIGERRADVKTTATSF